MRVCFEKNVHTLGFEFCKNSQPVALCSFSALKIARYVSHSAMLCLICSSDIPTQAQGVTSICWGCDDKKRNRKRCQMGYSTKTYTPKTTYTPRTTILFNSLPSTDNIFVCFLLDIVSPWQISTPQAPKIFTTCWTEQPLTAISSPCFMQYVLDWQATQIEALRWNSFYEPHAMITNTMWDN